MSRRGGPVGGRIAGLDALRGIAIALVVLFHARGIVTTQGADTPLQVGWFEAYVAGGHSGVTLFFVLSGFLLAPPFVAEARGGASVVRGPFLMRRARRILPLYWLIVVLAGIGFASTPRGHFAAAIPYLFFLNTFPHLTTQIWPWSIVWWTLATEVQYYLLLPLLPPLWRRVPGAVLALLVAAYLGLYATMAAGVFDLTVREKVVFFSSVLGRGFAFVGGATAALLVPAVRARLARFPAAVPSLVLLAIVAALSGLLQRVAAVGYLEAELRWNWWHIIEAALWSAVVLLVVATPVWGKRLLCSAGPVALGRWSYSLYLIHFPFLWYALHSPGSRLYAAANAWRLPKPAVAALSIGACLVLSALSYRLIERPFLARARAAPEPAATTPAVRDSA